VGGSARRRFRLDRSGRADPTATRLLLDGSLGLGCRAERGRQTVGVEAGGLGAFLNLDRALATRTTATTGRFLLDLGRGSLGGDHRLRLFGHDRLFDAGRATIVTRFTARALVTVATRAIFALLRLALLGFALLGFAGLTVAELALATRLLGLALLFAGANGIALVAIILGFVLEAVVILVVARILALATLILLL
jgi:hypothetical protein